MYLETRKGRGEVDLALNWTLMYLPITNDRPGFYI